MKKSRRSDSATSSGRVKKLEKIKTPSVFRQEGIVVYEGQDEDELPVYVVAVEVSDEERERHNDHRILPDGEVQLDFIGNPEMEKIRQVSNNMSRKKNLNDADELEEMENFNVENFLGWIDVCIENTVKER